MPIERLLAKTSFAPEAAARIKLAYEKTLLSLQLVDRDDPITEMIAKKSSKLQRLGSATRMNSQPSSLSSWE
jgi:hypothetical protein